MNRGVFMKKEKLDEIDFEILWREGNMKKIIFYINLIAVILQF